MIFEMRKVSKNNVNSAMSGTKTITSGTKTITYLSAKIWNLWFMLTKN